MTTNKKILIGCGALALVGLLVAIAGVIGLAYYVGSNPGYMNAGPEGEKFGRGVSQSACMSEGYRRARNIGMMEIQKSIVARIFVDSCLKTASIEPNFCDGVPGRFGEKTKWSDSECKSAGLDGTKSACIAVSQSKFEYCNNPFKE